MKRFLFLILTALLLVGPAVTPALALFVNSDIQSPTVTRRVSDIADLRLLTGKTAIQAVQLMGRVTEGDGGEGPFRWLSGDQSANAGVLLDTQGGVFVKPTTPGDGSTGVWVRQFGPDDLNINMFGAIPDDAISDVTAINAAIDFRGAFGVRKGGKMGALNGEYDIDSSIIMKSFVDLEGASFDGTYFNATTDTFPVIVCSNLTGFRISKIRINGNKGGADTSRGIEFFNCNSFKIDEVRVVGTTYGWFGFGAVFLGEFTKCRMDQVTKWGSYFVNTIDGNPASPNLGTMLTNHFESIFVGHSDAALTPVGSYFFQFHLDLSMTNCTTDAVASQNTPMYALYGHTIQPLTVNSFHTEGIKAANATSDLANASGAGLFNFIGTVGTINGLRISTDSEAANKATSSVIWGEAGSMLDFTGSVFKTPTPVDAEGFDTEVLVEGSVSETRLMFHATEIDSWKILNYSGTRDTDINDDRRRRSLRLDSNIAISGGAIEITGNYHTIDTEAAAASDDLDTINGINGFLVAGQELVIRTLLDTRDVVIKHNTGNIFLKGEADITLDLNKKPLKFIYNWSAARWMEI